MAIKVRAISLFIFLFLASCSPEQEVFYSTNPAVTPQSTDYWHPTVGMTLQIQFEGPFDTAVEADIYDLDLFDTDPAVITNLHTSGKKVVCYISVGSWEDWRPDADQFPSGVIGRNYSGWPGEKWLDIRQVAALAPVMSARLDLCALRGFDGVEPDNIGVLGNETGFPITYADQLAYALWLAQAAHDRGLFIGLKNAPEMAGDAVHQFDFALVEDCVEYNWCADLSPFIREGKPVFAVEYTDTDIDFQEACAQAQSMEITMMLKNRGLDAFRESCP
jgi:hypothetical protein